MIAYNNASMAVILVGGGHSSGKSTVCKAIKKELEAASFQLSSLVDIQLINMNEYLFNPLLRNEKTKVESKKAASDAKIKTDLSDTGHIESSLGQSKLGEEGTSAKPGSLKSESGSSSLSETKEESELIKNKNSSIALPSRFNFEQLMQDLTDSSSKVYNKDQHPNGKRKFRIFLVHGLYALYDKTLNKIALMKIFVDCDADTRLVRWIQRDTISSNRCSLEEVIEQYLNYARPEFSEFIFPTKEYSDTILTRGAESIGISLICDGIIPLISHKIKRLGSGVSSSGENSSIGLYPYKNKKDKENVTLLNYKESSNKPTVIVNYEANQNGKAQNEKEKLDVSGIPKLNIKGEQFTDQRGRFYDLT